MSVVKTDDMTTDCEHCGLPNWSNASTLQFGSLQIAWLGLSALAS